LNRKNPNIVANNRVVFWRRMTFFVSPDDQSPASITYNKQERLRIFYRPPWAQNVGAIPLHNEGPVAPAQFPFAEGDWNKCRGFHVHRLKELFLAPQPVALRFHTRSRSLSS
jgi:hypothetical protein